METSWVFHSLNNEGKLATNALENTKMVLLQVMLLPESHRDGIFETEGNELTQTVVQGG